MGSLIWQRLEGWAMAAHPGGLCAPRVRAKGNRNTAEPCTRSRARGGAPRAASSRRTAPDPRLLPRAPAGEASGAQERGDLGPSWPPTGAREQARPPGPFSSTLALHYPDGPSGAGPTLSEASRLRGSALGCRPRSATAPPWALCGSRAAETLNPLGCGARLSPPDLAPSLASARQPCGLAWAPREFS